jgi:hypothetical protein
LLVRLLLPLELMKITPLPRLMKKRFDLFLSGSFGFVRSWSGPPNGPDPSLRDKRRVRNEFLNSNTRKKDFHCSRSRKRSLDPFKTPIPAVNSVLKGQALLPFPRSILSCTKSVDTMAAHRLPDRSWYHAAHRPAQGFACFHWATSRGSMSRLPGSPRRSLRPAGVVRCLPTASAWSQSASQRPCLYRSRPGGGSACRWSFIYRATESSVSGQRVEEYGHGRHRDVAGGSRAHTVKFVADVCKSEQLKSRVMFSWRLSAPKAQMKHGWDDDVRTPRLASGTDCRKEKAARIAAVVEYA